MTNDSTAVCCWSGVTNYLNDLHFTTEPILYSYYHKQIDYSGKSSSCYRKSALKIIKNVLIKRKFNKTEEISQLLELISDSGLEIIVDFILNKKKQSSLYSLVKRLANNLDSSNKMNNEHN